MLRKTEDERPKREVLVRLSCSTWVICMIRLILIRTQREAIVPQTRVPDSTFFTPTHSTINYSTPNSIQTACYRYEAIDREPDPSESIGSLPSANLRKHDVGALFYWKSFLGAKTDGLVNMGNKHLQTVSGSDQRTLVMAGLAGTRSPDHTSVVVSYFPYTTCFLKALMGTLSDCLPNHHCGPPRLGFRIMRP
ncbi:unnamed protein product [Haemonchus placei]|uniref:Uncharacterized protein n=1 Tax=Haemonchus placei TaxID=6290 RepID=A0A0N4W4V5_HAEPC|nr:unnamed protein product [Haemonchus placei]